jgi:2-oxoglutarate dehydrogenase E1 component
VDLISSDHPNERKAVAIVRVEQLYPLRSEVLLPIFAGYPNLEDVVWVQEEPENMGAWPYMHPRLLELIEGRWPLHYVGRRANASPAEGSAAWHAIRQDAIIEQAFNLESEIVEKDVIRFKKT